MPYFVCDLIDLEGHGRALAGGDRDSTDLIEKALNDYESQGMVLQHIIPAKQITDHAVDRSHAPKFVFHKPETGNTLTLEDIERMSKE